MPFQRKIFRIEQMASAMPAAGHGAAMAPGGHHDILVELKALHAMIERRHPQPLTDSDDGCTEGLRRLKAETDVIAQALMRTRQDLAALHVDAFGAAPARVRRELDAVVESAAGATHQILDAAESIDDAAKTLSVRVRRDQDQALALDIQDSVLRIFEACNFQDLTGQRIAKVLATVAFVEQRIGHMIEIWGGIEALQKDAATAAGSDRSSLLHGPKLDGDAGHLSQADIDAMFAAR